MKFPLLLLGTALLLSACSSNDDPASAELGQSVELLYNRAADALAEDNYVEAIADFEEVERQHPYSKWATRAQLMAAYAAYKNQDYDTAQLALDRFIQLHPGNKDIDYAHYLKALTYYEQITDVARDQEMTKEALKALNTLIRLYPDSRYTRDAVLKRDLTKDHLAGKEMEIGRYYLKRGQTNAAMNRFRNVVKSYQTTTHVSEALHRLVECYVIVGLDSEATRVAAVLGHNYPGSKWYQRSYNLLDEDARAQLLDERSFIDRTIDSLLKPD